MKTHIAFASAVTLVAAGWATASFAAVVPGPAPLLGAGVSGLAIFAVAGGSYVAMRLRRRDRD